METERALTLLRPEIERSIRDATTELKLAYLETASGHLYAAFHAIQLEPINAKLETFADVHGIAITPEVELNAKQHFYLYRKKLCLISAEIEWVQLSKWSVEHEPSLGRSVEIFGLENKFVLVLAEKKDIATRGLHWLGRFNALEKWGLRPTNQFVNI